MGASKSGNSPNCMSPIRINLNSNFGVQIYSFIFMDNSIVLGNRNPFSQILILLGIALLSVAVFSFIPLLLAQPLFGIHALNNPSLFSQTNDPHVVAFMKFMQVMQSLGLFVIPPLIFSLIYHREVVNYLKLKFNFSVLSALLMVLIMISALPAINWLGELNGQLKLPAALVGIETWMKTMESEAEQLTKSFLVMPSISILVLNLIMIAIIPAIGEELLFRGALQSIFSELTKNKHLGIWISAILFSAMHLQFYGFFPRMLLGVLLGYTVVWTGSLWIPILGHFVNNGTAVIVSYLEQRGKISAEVETIGSTPDAMLWVVMSFCLVAGLLFWMKKNALAKHSVSLQ